MIKLLCPSNIDDGIHNGIVISLFIQNLRFLRDQLFDHIGIVSRKGLSHLGSGILGGGCLAHFNEAVQGDLVPVLHVRLGLFHIGNLLLGIIHKGLPGNVCHCCLRYVRIHRLSSYALHRNLFRSTWEKGLVLSVDVREEMLGALWQIKNRLKVDDLCGSLPKW